MCDVQSFFPAFSPDICVLQIACHEGVEEDIVLVALICHSFKKIFNHFYWTIGDQSQNSI
jgi:hypothetical protein